VTARQTKPRLPNSWVLLSEAVDFTINQFHLSEIDACKHIVDAAKLSSIFTSGRFYSEVGEPVFLVSPNAWVGMAPALHLNALVAYIRRLLSTIDREIKTSALETVFDELPEAVKLRTNWPSRDVQVKFQRLEPIPVIQHQFMETPLVCDVRIHWGSFDAWMMGAPRPGIPIFPAFPENAAHRLSPAIWGNPLPPLWKPVAELERLLDLAPDAAKGGENERRATEWLIRDFQTRPMLSKSKRRDSAINKFNISKRAFNDRVWTQATEKSGKKAELTRAGRKPNSNRRTK
jgi:hypothetical protein